MTNENQALINLPDPSRLISGLRDTGYNLNTAAADIIDNSIAANANRVNIELVLHQDGRKQLFFGDNGIGMEPAQLWDAMRYGAPKRSSPKSLGKFGLGLKTASSAICKRYALISRDQEGAALAKLAWDIDHVEIVNKWQMLQEAVTPDEQEAFERLCGKTGTLVVWSKCDKLLGVHYDEPGGSKEQNAIKRKRESLIEHVGMIFHKFLDSNYTEYPNVEIRINDTVVEPWNPFFPERSEQMLAETETVVTVESDNGSRSNATVRAWILPHSKDLTPVEDKKAKISSRAQGFYIYREGRMIWNGGWMGVFRSDDPHYSLLRAEFCFTHELDHAFHVPVNKSRIIFDPALEDELRLRLKGALEEANKRYRRKEQQIITGTTLAHAGSNKSIEQTKGRTKKPIVSDADPSTSTATLRNAVGIVKIRTRVQNNVSPESLYVEAVTDITDGRLWEPTLRSSGTSNHSIGVRLNKHHDFYSKVYLKAAGNGDAIEGIDFLLWALSAAEYNHNSEELRAMWEDLREEVSSNLRKLLTDVPMPDASDLGSIGGQNGTER